MSASNFLRLILLIAVCALGAGLSLGFLGRLHPAFDSFAHLRMHLAALLAAGGAALAWIDFRREGLAALSLAACSVIVTPGALPGLAGSRAALADEAPADRPVYRLLHLNARFDNPEPERFLSLIARLRPDVVTVNEVSAMWRQRLGTLSAAYPHQILCDARGVVGGVGILSRRPFAAGSAPQCLSGGSLALASVDLGGQWMTVASLHLYWPWPFEQPGQVAGLAEDLARLPDEAILAGDFNAVRWSNSFRRIAEAGRMRDAGPVGASWLPMSLPDTLRRNVGLGIDHVLAGDGVGVASVERMAGVGSDHLPVLVDFWLPERHRPETGDTTVVRSGATSPAS